MTQPATMVDPRQPRFGQAITGTVLLLGFLAELPIVLPVLAALLAGASLLGPRWNLYAYLYPPVKRLLGPPSELEEAAPPRFANTLGFLFLTAATFAHYGFGTEGLAWGLGLLVSGLALLAAVTGLCVGCEFYVLARRVATKGRVSRRITRPVERTGVPG
ncbi:MAG TPA: DUF4395 domain-containing protein [Actinomycetota bacterium]|nr:DUF4395 domain-containing protein [Actinomycetota bacterium]